MSRNNDYKKGKVVDATTLLPEYTKTDILEGISDNIFNRFLTKKDFEKVNGYVGKEQVEAVLNKIPEAREFLEKNQLQPVLRHDVGTDTDFMSFEQFLRLLKSSGVDMDSFDEWGKLLQFNFYPPIDIDKIINYQNYYWTDQDSAPEYITMKNESTNADARLHELKNSVFSIVQGGTATSTSQTIVDTEIDGIYVIFDINQNEKVLVRKSGSTLTNIEGSSSGATIEYVPLTFNVTNITTSEIRLTGNRLENLRKGYVVSLYVNETGTQELAKVSGVTYDEVAGVTALTFEKPLSTASYNYISLHPAIMSEVAERTYFNNIDQTNDIDEIDVFGLGEAIWYKKKKIVSFVDAASSSVGSTITDPSTDFTTHLSSGIDYKVIIPSGPNRGTYDIESFSTNSVTLKDSLLFEHNNDGVIYVDNDLSSKSNVTEGDFFFDEVNDELQQYLSGTWQTKAISFSYLYNMVRDISYDFRNDWSESNKWVHRTQLSSLSLTRQASMPIIEYQSYLEFSEFSNFQFKWEYSGNIDEEHVEIDADPNLLEINPVEVDASSQVEYEGIFTVRLPDKYGNLTGHINKSDKLIFSGFSINDGTYTVNDVVYKQRSFGQRYATEITLTEPFVDLSDSPTGAMIYPQSTSQGDPFNPNYDHWLFNGVEEVVSSSLDGEINPMLVGPYTGYSGQSATGESYETLLGLYFQEFNFNGSYSGARIDLDRSLHDLCLIEDYQEGDLRLYINGKRIYNKFNEGSVNGDYVTHIVLDNDVTITSEDNVRIELGEYLLKDIGKKDVSVPTDYTIEEGQIERYNLAENRRTEQVKVGANQYPLFKLYDIFGNPLAESNPIFWFKEDSASPINSFVFKRVSTKRSATDYLFEHGLKDDQERLRCYKDLSDDELKTIWRSGENNEIDVPHKIDGDWDITNSWYYNIEHELEKEVSLIDLFRHFKTIQMAQDSPFLAGLPENAYHAIERPNHGLGGTIKEHNGNLDLLASAFMSRSVDINKVIDFAGDQYRRFLFEAENYYLDNITSFLDGSKTTTDYYNYIENDSRLDRLFGDSTAYYNEKGIPNFIATSSILRLSDCREPLAYQFRNEWNMLHHDGHRSVIRLNNADKLSSFKTVTKNYQVVSKSSNSFPDTSEYEDGDYIIRAVRSVDTVNLYELVSGSWVLIDIETEIKNIILDIETRLYAACGEISADIDKQYYLDRLETNNKFAELEKAAFDDYYCNQDPLSNTSFDSADAFTWNYAYTPLPDNPVEGNISSESAGSWQALYEKLYQTPYPNFEPWKLQGYKDKPSWWDTEYLNQDLSKDWTWKRIMWNNILSGIIPSGEILPDGDVSSETVNEADFSYGYLPVNITNTVLGGVEPDGLIPPYWDGSQSSNPSFKPLFDKSNQEFIRTPSTDFLYGQNGYKEWLWKQTVDYIHARISIAFKLDPINFFSKSYGDQYKAVDCLLIDSRTEKVNPHNETVFHGEEVDGVRYVSHGIQQWIVHHNRYNNLDGSSTIYRKAWKEWEPRISYIFNSFINDKTLAVKGNAGIDITNRDYEVDILKDNTRLDELFAALKVIIKKLPSRYNEGLYSSKDWAFDIIPETPNKVKSVKTYHPQNYEFRQLSSTEFAISSYELSDVNYERPVGFWKATYNNPLSLSTITALNTDTNYQTTIELDSGVETVNVIIEGSSTNPPTVESVINSLNTQLDNATVSLESGSIIIESNNTNPSISEVTITSDSIFSTLAPGLIINSGLTDWTFNKVFYIAGNKFQYFEEGDEITIESSTNFNGTYTVQNVSYDLDLNRTAIKVEEDVILNDDTIDGIIVPQDALTLPWENGQEVYLDTDGVLPTGLKTDDAYFVVKESDYVFKLSNTQENAEDEKTLTLSTNGVGCFWIGNLLRTFRPLGGDPDHAFNRYEPDTRSVREYTGRVSISRIQNLIDFVLGYNDYLNDIGILSENERLDNVDDVTGRGNEWQVEIEKFISWANKLLVNKRAFSPEIGIEVNIQNNSFTPRSTNIFSTGDRVSLDTEPNSGEIPDELVSPFNTFIPYYLIRNNNGDVQLAYTERDALDGRSIPFASGFGNIVLRAFKENRKHPSRVMNPYKVQFSVEHERGLLETYTDIDARTNVFEKQSLYNANLETISPNEVLFYRKDKKSKVALTEESRQEIRGGKVSFIEVAHICHFNNYTTGNKLLYDAFLGINTPRVFLEYLRPTEATGRPTVGGLVLNDSSLIDSIEKSIEDIRFYYDPYKVIESDQTAIEAKRSLGYQGPNDYMLDLDINEKSQFIFWKSFIQNKGTNKSLAAFTNQRNLSNITVDEFWAYRLCSFGDSSKKAYPEIKLKTSDVVKKELRLEFSPPTGGVLGSEHVPIRLTDIDRWNNLPDVLRLMEPYSAYYFDSEILEVFENAENLVKTAPFQSTTGYKGLRFSKPAFGVIVTYRKNGTVFTAKEDLDYRLINSQVIEFTAKDFAQWSDIKIAPVSYAYSAENPLRLVETKRPEKVITDIPIWNPAFGEHNPLGNYPVDIENSVDPAKYNEDLNQSRISDNTWNRRQVGKVWLDTSIRYYKPYFDVKLYPDEYNRSLLWGALEDFADITMYKWVESKLSPEEYIAKVETDKNKEIPLSDKTTGSPRKVVYKNTGTVSLPIWEEEKHKISKFPVAGFDIANDGDVFEAGETVDIYKNGVFFETITYVNASNISAIINIRINGGSLRRKDFLTMVYEPHEPTEEELDNGDYIIVYPHTQIRRYNNRTREEESFYYYWVSDMKSEKLLRNQSLTLFDAEREYKEMTSPYAIIGGFRYEGVGYGVLFGSTYDPENNSLPTRFSQCIIKGLRNTVKDNTNYILRLVKDFTLRDTYPATGLGVQNKHWSWKLIRRNSPAKIDRLLWKKVIEAATGREVVNDDFDIDPDSSLPIESRVRYDALVDRATTRIGLYNGSVMLDKTAILDLTMEILFDPNSAWERVEIESFVNGFDLTRNEGIKDFYASIYNNFLNREINGIFFELLEKSVETHKKHPDFFKTSWVSVDVANNVIADEDVGLEIVDVYPTDVECADEQRFPSPTPSPTPTPTPSVTPTSSVTPTPTPTPTSSVTPTSTVTPTPSVTSTVTPTPTPSASQIAGLLVNTVEYETIEDPAQSLSISAQSSGHRGFTLKPDGTRFFAAGNTSQGIYQYDLSTAWDLNSSTYNSVFLDISGEISNVVDVKFNDTGTSVFALGGITGGDLLQEYLLGTAWDLSSVTGTGNSFTFSSGAYPDTINRMQFSPDGTTLIVGDLGFPKGILRELALSTAWDLTTMTATGSTQTTLANGVDAFYITDDGSTMYITEHPLTNAPIFEYTLTIPWDITTAEVTRNMHAFISGTATSLGEGLYVNESLGYFYGGNSGGPYARLDLATITPANSTEIITTGTYGFTSVTYEGDADFDTILPGTTYRLGGLSLTDGGSKMIIFDGNRDYMYMIGLSTPYDISTAVHILDRKSFTDFDLNPVVNSTSILIDYVNGVEITPDGARLFVTLEDFSNNWLMIQYDLSTPNLLGSATPINSYDFDADTSSSYVYGTTFADAGTKMYLMADSTISGFAILQYSLSTPYDISTLSLTATHEAPNIPPSGFPVGIQMLSGGDKLLVGVSNNRIEEYTLNTPYDITTINSPANNVIDVQAIDPLFTDIDGGNEDSFYYDSVTNRVYVASDNRILQLNLG